MTGIGALCAAEVHKQLSRYLIRKVGVLVILILQSTALMIDGQQLSVTPASVCYIEAV